MPLTSYALKTFGSSIALMLTAFALVPGSLGVAAEAGGGAPSDVLALVELRRGNPPETVLARLDPVTLSPRGPQLDLGSLWPRDDLAVARSPDGKVAAINPWLKPPFLVDLETMTHIAPLPADATFYLWPSPRRLLAVNDHTQKVTLLDPVSQSIIRTYQFPSERGSRPIFFSGRLRGGAAVLRAGLGQPLQVVTINPERARSFTLRRLWYGHEYWPAGRADPLPPRARAVLEQARAEVARLENVRSSAVRPVAVTPLTAPSSALGCPSTLFHAWVVTDAYQLILDAAGRRYDFRGTLDSAGRTRFCRFGSTPSPRNLLTVGPQVTQVPVARLAIDPRRGRAFVVAPDGVLAQLDSGARRVRYGRLSVRIPSGRYPHTQWLGEGRIAFGSSGGASFRSSGVHLINVRNGRVTRLAAAPCDFTARVSLLLVHGYGCPGLRGYTPTGKQRFDTGLHSVWQLQWAGKHAYIRPFDGDPDARYKTLHVVDLSRGEVVGSARVAGYTRILRE